MTGDRIDTDAVRERWAKRGGADRNRLRAAITEALAHLDRHPPMHLEQCAPCRVRRTLTDALQGGAR